MIDIGGIPGINCNGFCKFCYFKNIKSTITFGCKNCYPFKKGCYYCTYGIREASNGFKPLKQVLEETLSKLFYYNNKYVDTNIDSFIITGGGDISCYPHLFELLSFLSDFNIPIKLGYTSGKGFCKNDLELLLNYNIKEINYSLFSSDEKLRKIYLNDKNPKHSLEIFHELCDNFGIFATILLIKNVNDNKYLENTLDFIENTKCKGVILMRFSNFYKNGLILENSPILDNIYCHTINEFENIINKEATRRTKMRISGTPIGDPYTGAPFSILKHKEYLKKLPIIKKQATIITGSIAFIYLEKIFSIIGNNLVNIIAVNKEIACLMTEKDLKDINLNNVKETVFVPGRCLIHDSKLNEFFKSDGINRIVRRGPETLSVDGEISISMSVEEVLNHEIKNFSILINHINSIGMIN